MNTLLKDISNELAKVTWQGKIPTDNITIKDNWPFYKNLTEMKKLKRKDEQELWEHTFMVIASVNQIVKYTDESLGISDFLIDVNDEKCKRINAEAKSLIKKAFDSCWHIHHQGPCILGENKELAIAFLRVAALYHDIGKLITSEHHVQRGVHLMRDVDDVNRRMLEGLFDSLMQRRCFWTVLRNHDVFGVLCTGEASIAALVDVIGWVIPKTYKFDPTGNAITRISYLLWLNIADSNAALVPNENLGGLQTVEAKRYLSDWMLVSDFFDSYDDNFYEREGFRRWALNEAERPDKTVDRISRIISSSYRMQSSYFADENLIKLMVEEALEDQHGPRFDDFCFKFARFCKLDYALRFFRLLMDYVALFANAAHTSEGDCGIDAIDPPSEKLTYKKPDSAETENALRLMVGNTCLVLHRIVEEYGHLLDEPGKRFVLLGVDMSKLTSKIDDEARTGWAICKSLQKTPSSALSWVMDEVSIWLYRG